MSLTFYYCVHPGDLSRRRLPQGVPVMLIASAFWDDSRKRFAIRRPPADHVGSLVIDSGGFTAARRWGSYPWTPEHYADFLREEARDVPLTWAASMDYACEREVNRQTYRTNLERIRITICNELHLRSAAPDIPWLGVLQGNTPGERLWDVRRRRRLGLLHPVMGVGSICGRKAREAADVLRLCARWLPGTRFHGFGLDVRTLDQGDDIALSLASWDSYAWNWPRGRTSSRPTFLHRLEGESRSEYTMRLAVEYQRSAIRPRLVKPRQVSLEMFG